MIIEKEKNYFNLKKNTFIIKSKNIFQTSKKKLMPIKTNRTLYNFITKEFPIKRNMNKINCVFNLYKNFNYNNIRGKIFEQMCNELSEKKEKKDNKDNIKKDEIILNSFNKPHTIAKYDKIVCRNTVNNNSNKRKIFFDNQINNNNIKILNYENKFSNYKIHPKINIKNEFKTILIKKNLSMNNYSKNNFSNDLKYIDEDKNSILSSKNSFFFIPKKDKKKTVDSLCQTNLSEFDLEENEEKENKNEMLNQINKSIFPFLYINKKKLKELINKNNKNKFKNKYINIIIKTKKKIQKRNNALSLQHSKTSNLRGLSFLDYNTNKTDRLKIKKILINDNIDNIENIKKKKNLKYVCDVNQINLQLKIDKK